MTDPRSKCKWCGKRVEPREGVCCDKCYATVMWHVLDGDDE